MHRLLERQLRKARDAGGELCVEKLIEEVAKTYAEYEVDRKRLERASRLMSEELETQNLELERQRVEAEQANAAKSVFLANMSHEIRTPLNGVIALADALSKTELSANQREMVGLVRASGGTLERLLTDILDLSKIEAGKLEIKAERFNLREMIQAAAHVILAQAREKGLAFSIEYEGATDGYFIGDAVRISQMVTNLASNAVKFTARGGVTIRVGVTDRASADLPLMLTVSISDTGIGFDAETASRLFGRFEQADSSITKTFGGTGLGLAITRSLARAMRGDVTADSVPGAGSTFTITLPIELAVSPTFDARADASVRPAADWSHLSILVVEDNALNRRVVQLLLGGTGAQLTFAEDGAQGVAMFQEGRFDVVLMDMQMPIMDGLTATRRIREFEQHTRALATPVIVLSANAMNDHIEGARCAGADLHVPKPFTAESLCTAIRQALHEDEWVPSALQKTA
jgi:two-component system, sensor histidine kinase